MSICDCKQGYGSPYGIGICMNCGRESCNNYFGCSVSDPEHECKNQKMSNRWVMSEWIDLGTFIVSIGILLVNIVFYAKKWKTGNKG